MFFFYEQTLINLHKQHDSKIKRDSVEDNRTTVTDLNIPLLRTS